MENIMFSIITVCFNSINTIEKTFLSVINQSYSETFEYIVIDGGSSDGTVEMIKKYEKQFEQRGIIFKWLSKPDKGIYNAMNKGINMAQGSYIGIINSDDTYTLDALVLIKEEIDRGNIADIYHGLMRFFHDGRITMIRGLSDIRLSSGMFEHPTCFVKKEIYELYGTFDERYRYVADYEFMLRIREKCTFYMIENILANFDEDGAGNSYRARVELAEFRKEKKMDSILKYMFTKLKIYLREKSEK